MSRSRGFYLDLIPTQHARRPRFVSTVDLSTLPFTGVERAAADLPRAFSLDEAVGPQLDAVGVRAGLSRRVNVPVAGAYFSFDDPARGWERGTWYDPLYGDEVAVALLDDDTYRQMCRAKILSNAWDGTLPQAQAIVEAVVDDPEVLVFVEDDGTSTAQSSFFAFDGLPSQGWDAGTLYPIDLATDPTGGVPAVPALSYVVNPGLTVGVAGRLPPVAIMFVLEQQLAPVKPAGVPVTVSFASVYGAPLFGFDVQSEYISGFDEGAWGVSAQEVLDAPPGVVYPLSSQGA